MHKFGEALREPRGEDASFEKVIRKAWHSTVVYHFGIKEYFGMRRTFNENSILGTIKRTFRTAVRKFTKNAWIWVMDFS